jgi:hypothetical protein
VRILVNRWDQTFYILYSFVWHFWWLEETKYFIICTALCDSLVNGRDQIFDIVYRFVWEFWWIEATKHMIFCTALCDSFGVWNRPNIWYSVQFWVTVLVTRRDQVFDIVYSCVWEFWWIEKTKHLIYCTALCDTCGEWKRPNIWYKVQLFVTVLVNGRRQSFDNAYSFLCQFWWLEETKHLIFCTA